MEIDATLEARRSVRAFLPKEVPEETLREIFGLAQRAPSWCNIQPWRVAVASGATRVKLTQAFARAALESGPRPDVPFTTDYPEPYATHRRDCGVALYRAMGVERGDLEGRSRAWHRNFVAFDAPHVAIVGIDRRLELHAAIDVGCWLQSVLLIATSRGVATCPQASLCLFPDIARSILDISNDVKILFGIGLGYEDPSAPANACRTTREPLGENVRFFS